MSGLESLAGEHPGRVLGRRIFVAARTASTHDDARAAVERLGARECHGFAFTALEQTAGRGTRGRTWWSPSGASLPLSIVVAPEVPFDRPAALTLAAALGFAAAAEAFGADVRIKWPNDGVDRAGRKLCGVLAETLATRPPAHVLGIGVNVLEPDSAAPEGLERTWTSLQTIRGPSDRDLVPAAFALELLGAIEREVGSLQRDGVAPLARRFRDRSFLTGRPVTLQRGRERRSGTFAGLSDSLDVLLAAPDGATTAWPAEQVELADWR